MGHTASQNNRETWLRDALYDFVRPLFTEAGYDVPFKIRVGCGWPSKSALAKKRRIGEAWTPTCSADETHEIIVSLCIGDPAQVLDVLIHEVVHAVVGVEHGHKKPFSQCAKAVGLVKPWTATSPSPELSERIAAYLANDADPYPHATLDKTPQEKKQSTRMILLECDCEAKVRTTQKWIDAYGDSWPCPCGGTLVLQQPKLKLDD